MPRYSEQGTWTTDWCYTEDNAGNTEWLYPAQLLSKGFPTTFAQLDPGDTAPPQLTGFEFTSPSTVMTGSADAVLTVTATATDDLSGLHVYMACRYFSPDGTVPADMYGWLSDEGGTTGQYALTLTMPQYSVPGVWTISTCMLQDKANNTAWITPSSMQAAGMPTTFAVE